MSLTAINLNFKGVLQLLVSKAVTALGCTMECRCPSRLTQALWTLRNATSAAFFFSWGNVIKISLLSFLPKYKSLVLSWCDCTYLMLCHPPVPVKQEQCGVLSLLKPIWDTLLWLWLWFTKGICTSLYLDVKNLIGFST